MFIGSLFDNRLDKAIKYSYRHRGSDRIYNPDLIKEMTEREYYTRENGSLFFRNEVSWQDTVLIKDGIDLKIETGGSCFIDHICLLQGKGSAIKSIEVFIPEHNRLKKVGNYSPETGQHITTEEIKIPVGVYSEQLMIRLNGNSMPVSIKAIDVWGAWELEDSVWPIPETSVFKKEKFPLSELKTVKAVSEEEVFAAKYLQDKLYESFGHTITITKDDSNFTMTAEGEEQDAYILHTEKGKCSIKGSNKRSLLYGADALLQLICDGMIKCCHIDHHDFMEFRGVHFALPNKDQTEFIKNMVKYVFIPMHYNMVYLQIAGAMHYDKYPEISQAWAECNEKYEKGEWPKPAHYGFVGKDIWEKDEVRALCDYFEAYGLEVIPEVQSWAHTQYITCAYPHLAEQTEEGYDKNANIDLNVKDLAPNDFYLHTMCPNHPDYYSVIFGILDEVLEVVRPKRFVHMGHDEIYEWGKCPICSKIPGGELYAKEVTTLNDYIKSKNLTMMIWGDMIQVMDYSTPAAINLVPKDIIMLDFVWYFHLDSNIEDNLLEHGFQVIMGNMYSSHYPRYDARSKKKGIIGAEVSTWVECSEFSYGFEGKMYDFVYSATGICNRDYRTDLRLTYTELVKPIMKSIRERIGNLTGEGTETSVAVGGTRENIPFDIRDIVSYDTAVLLNESAPSAEIAIDGYANIISFVHAAVTDGRRVPWDPAYQAGRYDIVYEDGKTVSEPVSYGGNVYKYRSTYGKPIKARLFRHQGYVGTYLAIPECGKTHNGEDYTLYHYSMRNPYPNSKIKSIVLNYSEEAGTDLLVFDIKIK